MFKFFVEGRIEALEEELDCEKPFQYFHINLGIIPVNSGVIVNYRTKNVVIFVSV